MQKEFKLVVMGSVVLQSKLYNKTQSILQRINCVENVDHPPNY